MGSTVELASNGNRASGYLAIPASGSGPGVMVVQEWWGLVRQIRGVCDSLAVAGFVALAPDLFHGELVEHTEIDRASALMATLPADRAARDMACAIDFLLAHPGVRGSKVGVVGFCMGGVLTLLIAAQQGDRIGAAVPYYGAPLGDDAPDWSELSAPVLGHFAEHDDWIVPSATRALEATLRAMGKDVTFYFYPGTGHAFANEENPRGTYDEQAARQAWGRTVEFLRAHLS